MKTLDKSELQSTYFFDLPLSDVYGIGCAALRLIYHGDEHGAFASKTKEALDLDVVQAFQITLKHRTVTPLSDQFAYYLVYYQKDLGISLWNHALRKGCPTLRKMTRRVGLTNKASLKPNRIRQLYIKENRPVHIARFDCEVPTDHYVPQPYIDDFADRFDGFLMRSKRAYPLVTSLFDAQGLSLAERRDVSIASPQAPHVLAYC